MNFHRKKTYGQYKTTTCPFCQRTATIKNPQGLDVCHKHQEKLLDDIKCLCGSWLDVRSGKFGPYFHCEQCGNISYQKAMTIKESTQKSPEKTIEQKQTLAPPHQPTETIISTNDVEYFS